jgi:FkbM family methyltransferase
MEKLTMHASEAIVYARSDSPGDRGSIDGVFKLMDYEIDGYKAFPAVQRYHDIHAQSRRPLIIDAGANIGTSAIYFNLRWNTAKIYCIEPERKNFTLLNLNLAEIDADTIQAGVASKIGSMFLFDPSLGDMGFRLAAEGTISVPTITIQSILDKYHIESYFPFICKIDIEGGEEELFRGDYSWVTEFPVITIETHDWMQPFKLVSKNLFKMLAEYNFDVILRRSNLILFNKDLLAEYL